MAFTFADRMHGLSGNVIRDILKLTQQPEIISFAGGLPSPDSFPVDQLSAVTECVFKKYGKEMLQYGTTEGCDVLRDYVALRLQGRGIRISGEDVLILSGSQQGLDLLSRICLNPGDGVVVERPTYLAAVQIFKGCQARFYEVESDRDGMIPESLENVLSREEAVKLIYVVPNFANPTGRTLPIVRRQKLAEIACNHGCLLIEDDPYAELRYRGQDQPAIKSFDHQGHVVYLGSFSKIISPGLRVGYATCSMQEVLRKMAIVKQGADVHTGNLSQLVIYEYASSGLLEDHIAQVRADYGRKLELMLAAMDTHFPATVEVSRPDGGLFVWVTLPEGCSSTDLLQVAIKRGVAFIPGSPFFATGGGENTMRINFSNASAEEIEGGIKILGEVIAGATAAN